MAKTSDKTYLYSGPLTGVTLEDGRELTLIPGCEYQLPATEYIDNLVNMARLTEVSVPETVVPATKKEVA